MMGEIVIESFSARVMWMLVPQSLDSQLNIINNMIKQDKIFSISKINPIIRNLLGKLRRASLLNIMRQRLEMN